MQIIGYVAADGIVASALHVSGAIKANAVVDVVFAIELEKKPEPSNAAPTVRTLRTFGAVPSEADLRYPATRNADGTWKEGVRDEADPKLLTSFRLDDASALDDGVYRNPNVNSTGPLVRVFKITAG